MFQKKGPTSLLNFKRSITLALIVFALSLFAAPAIADDRIGFIDLQKALSDTKEWKEKSAKFKVEFEREQKMISAREASIAKMLEDINKQSMVMDPELKKKKEEEFRAQSRDFQRYVKDKSDEFSNKEKEMTAELVKKMVDVIQRLGKEKKFTMIVEKKGMLYTDPGKELTPHATRAYDKIYK
ncbi:MAG: OmpH family outer membrane protein [Candidatus Nitrohelix vancouverensis]|uniref:OmpH family outer membrane protein n=1 Tax=Candidatus Nitrohelix vancouverensis TaxID=2705534 RepID=A0A7T0BZT9_9BACT|nr:MAG: OmpH family outer membrane protein [Candidatus Nitrohelix vancouverensis]